MRFALITASTFACLSMNCSAGTSDDSLDLGGALEQEFGALTDAPSDSTESDEADANAAGQALDETEGQPGEIESPVDSSDPGTTDTFPRMIDESALADLQAWFVRVAWGNFPVNPSLRGQRVDYSGDIRVDTDDAIRRVRSWRFERNGQDDHVERPRTDKALFDFSSTITIASDGVHFLVLARDGESELKIRLGSTQFEKSYDLASTEHLREENASATASQSVHVRIDRIHHAPGCKAGALVGHWITKETNNGRSLYRVVGRALGPDGLVTAKVVGLAGTRGNGDTVLFLKIFDGRRLLGVAKGTYDAAANTFSADVYGPGRRQVIGSLSGSYAVDASDPTAGNFEGTYSAGLACNQPAGT